MLYILLFILGLIIGSFLNVVSMRYSPEYGFFDSQKRKKGLVACRFSLSTLNWFGRSRCSHCGRQLRWHELVPVISFIIQLGKCRTCKAKLSLQYPLVELATGFIFLGSLVNGVFWTLIFLIFLLIWAIDYRLYIIPNELNISLAVLGIARIAVMDFYGRFSEFQGSFLGSYAALFGFRQNIWLNHFAAAAIAAALFSLIIYLTKGRGMGMGDLKLMAALGLVFGWPDVIFAAMFAFLIGGAAAAALLIFGKKGMKSHLPFGPFIILGALTLIFFGQQILDCYFGIFNF